jgi:hypothetical protein
MDFDTNNIKQHLSGNTNKVCLTCAKELTPQQRRKRPTAQFCSLQCFSKYRFSHFERIYNEKFIEDKKLLAYFLGLWSADGGIASSKKNYGMVYLTSSDKQLVDDLVIATGYLGKVEGKLRKDKYDSKGVLWRSTRPQFALTFTGAVAEYIQKLGYEPGPKTGKEFLPREVNDEMFPHFLRGFIDGNGTVAHARKYLQVSMVSASKNLLNAIYLRLKQANIAYSRSDVQQPGPYLYRLAFAHADSVRICNYIYADAPIKLERKYQKYVECKDLVLEKEIQAGSCSHEGCNRLAASKGLCKLHFDAVYHQAHKDDPEVRAKGRDAVQRYRAAHHDELLERRRELYAAEPYKHRQAVQAYRERNPEKVKEYKQEYRQTHKESINEYKKRYRQENPEMHKELGRRKYLKNKDKVSIRGKDYYEKNKEKIKARCAAYKEKKGDYSLDNTKYKGRI